MPAPTRFEFQGGTYVLAERVLVRETAIYERQAGRGIDSWTGSEGKAAHIGVSLMRAGVLLSWEELLDLALEDDIRILPEEDAREGEGTEVGEEMLPPADAGAESAGPPPSTTTETTSG